ncbi:MAG: LptF/LptG family permease [Parachlamydiaceae bacterium]
MPLLWRYLLAHYLKVFFLCVTAFIAILLTLRLGEIAYFATLGPQAWNILWFILQQIPYVLPIAFPVSALISSLLLVQSLSHSRELTAMRSCGFSIKNILAPVLVAALFLSFLNFYIISELSTISHFHSAQIKNQLRSVNPLLLLNNKTLMHMKGLYFDTLGASKLGEFAADIILLAPGARNDRLSLLVAKRIDVTPDSFSGTHVTLLTSRPSKENSEDEHLVIENLTTSLTSIEDFSRLLDKKIWQVNNDHLPLTQLLVRKEETGRQLQEAIALNIPPAEIREVRHNYIRTVTEIIRRFSVAMAVFTFTLMGLSFGISISRIHSNFKLVCIIGLSALYLIAFFIAKSFDQALIAATTLYLIPHILICISSLWVLRRVSQGVE